MGMSTPSSLGGWQSTVGSATKRKPRCDGSGQSSLATTIPTESSLCVVSLCLRTLVPCGGVEEQLLRERDIFSTIGWPFGSDVHGLPNVPLWHEDKSIAEIAAIASARARRRVFRCLWPGWCAHVDSPRPSVRFNERVPVVGCLRSSRQEALERTGPTSVDLLSPLSERMYLLGSAGRCGHLFLDLWAVHPAPAVSVQAFLESVLMGGSSFQKHAACPHAAMRVLGGLTFLSTHLGLDCYPASVCPALVASGDDAAGNHKKKTWPGTSRSPSSSLTAAAHPFSPSSASWPLCSSRPECASSAPSALACVPVQTQEAWAGGSSP